MNPIIAKILEDALRLPPEARAALAGSLLDSITESPDPDAEAAWEAEISRRIRELDENTVKLIPWSEARRAILRGMTAVYFHPEAVAEARAAREWYAERSLQAADAFVVELDTAIAQIAETPDRWPQYVAGTRRYLLRRFPFLIVYRLNQDRLEVLAVAQGHRRPGYWRERRGDEAT